MPTAEDNYKEATWRLLRARRDAGGTLPDDKEDTFMDELDDLWDALDEDERGQLNGIDWQKEFAALEGTN